LEIGGKAPVVLRGIHEALLEYVLRAIARIGFFPHEAEHVEVFDLHEAAFMVPLAIGVCVSH